MEAAVVLVETSRQDFAVLDQAAAESWIAQGSIARLASRGNRKKRVCFIGCTPITALIARKKPRGNHRGLIIDIKIKY